MSKSFLNPTEVTSAVISMGISRGNEKNNMKTLISGFVAGMFIALAAIGNFTASQTLAQTFDVGFSKFIGACIFPIGLMLCIFTGSSLFTGNSLLSLAFLSKELKFSNLIKNLTTVWIGNFLGSFFTAYLAFYAGVFNSPIIQKIFLDTGISKIGLSFSQCVASGFFCNILVVMGIIMAMSSNDVTGKILGCWFPIMLFVLCGYQHVVANMFIIAVGKILSPENFSLLDIFVKHFLPTTIGNFLSGGVFLPLFLYFSYYQKNSNK
ncbi:formate/nitrite transporter family protein [Fusobacterium varium]|nr:formate/nitrite transporter family protein [Fusobacterium varium]